MSLGNGAKNQTLIDILKQSVSPLIKGKAFDSLVAAIADGDLYKQQTLQNAFNQLFIDTAESKYLDRKGSNFNIQRPHKVGIKDNVFRNLLIKTSTSQQILTTILEVLEIIYGSESVRANETATLFEPYSLQDQDTLLIQINGGDILTVTFETDDFSQIGAATAFEVAGVITRNLRKYNSNAYAISIFDPINNKNTVRIFSDALGMQGSLRIWGGRAQNKLQFPTIIATTQDNTTQFQIEIPPTAGISTDRARFTWTGGTNPSLQFVNVNDYVNIYGTVFNVNNRGPYKIVVSTPTFFEIENSNAVAEVVILNNVSDIEFYTPTKYTVQSNKKFADAIQTTDNELDVLLPAVTRIIERDSTSAAYLHQNTILDISAASRDNTGLVTVTSTNHGLSSNQWVFIDGLYPENNITLSGTLGWSLQGSIAAFPQNMAGCKLQDGRIFACIGTVIVLYDPDANTITVGPPMAFARSSHTATLLNNGKVLIVGGSGTTDVELYDPISDTCTTTALMSTARSAHQAILMKNGKVAIIGGNAGVNTNIEIYDPDTATWALGATPAVDRSNFGAALLPDGRILACGGWDTGVVFYASGEVYNPLTNTWTNTSDMINERAFFATINLITGRTLIAGGKDHLGNYWQECETFNPATLTFSSAANIGETRISPAVCTLNDNTILLSGGEEAGPIILSSVYRYDPINNVWGGVATAVPPDVYSNMVNPHSKHLMFLLNDGRVFEIGNGRPELYSSPVNIVSAGGLNGLFRITVTDGDHFTYQTIDEIYETTALTGGTVIAIKGASNGINGPFVFDANKGLGITSVSTTTTSNIQQNNTYKVLNVSSTANFPNQEGYLVLNFSKENETAPVHYLGILSNTEILLDPNFIFTKDINSGATVILLSQRGPFVPSNPEQVGTFYLTASAAGRLLAQQTIEDISAAGVKLNEIVEFSGDRGLGNEGSPTSGNTKLSDIVEVFGSDDLDAEIEKLRE